MYDGDSFHTLSSGGQIGLAAVSLLLSGATFIAAGYLFRLVPDRGLPVQLSARIGVAVFAMWSFIWLSPQLYYLYYQSIFDGLPWQIVIQNPPEFHAILGYFTFTGPATLSDHSKGILAWLLIAFAVARPLWQSRKQQSVPRN
ncbi:hypothetical protein [Pelagibius sp. Alg239-R121]|uniref:hypothetical protein n=1 Tax=Pelagibius sp. Alg239-R121 TaxID=2993448 RepID=UPI0024A638B5|nr:hypothetical protein [Pelagibius sp. Alg239-R121]